MPSFSQLQTFFWIYFAYVCCYLLRKNFPLIIPSLDKAGVLTVAQAGAVTSVFETVMGVVKFFGGSFVDGVKNQARLLSLCLFIAGLSSLLLYLVFANKNMISNDFVYVSLVALLWSMNGVGQSLAWPALAQIFLNWFPSPTERGSWYSMLSTNQNVGSTLSPRIYPLLIASIGWPVALYAPSLLTLVYATLMYALLSTAPPQDSVNDNDGDDDEKPKHNNKKKTDNDEKDITNPGFVKSIT